MGMVLCVVCIGAMGFFSILYDDKPHCNRYCAFFYIFRLMFGRTGTAFLSFLPWLAMAFMFFRGGLRCLDEQDVAEEDTIPQNERSKKRKQGRYERMRKRLSERHPSWRWR